MGKTLNDGKGYLTKSVYSRDRAHISETSSIFILGHFGSALSTPLMPHSYIHVITAINDFAQAFGTKAEEVRKMTRGIM